MRLHRFTFVDRKSLYASINAPKSERMCLNMYVFIVF